MRNENSISVKFQYKKENDNDNDRKTLFLPLNRDKVRKLGVVNCIKQKLGYQILVLDYLII